MRFETGAFLYTLFSAVGLVSGLVTLKALNYPKKQHGLEIKHIMPVIVIGAIIGSKIPVALSYGPRPEILLFGKSLFGALIGSFFAMRIFKLFKGIKGYFGDRFVIPICISAGIGKIGCFFYGCCGGTETNFAFAMINTFGEKAHPVQLYEAAFQFLAAGLFYYFHRKNKYQSTHFIMYIVIYMIFRFIVEYIRIEPKALWGLSVYQGMSILFLPFFGYILYRRLKSA